MDLFTLGHRFLMSLPSSNITQNATTGHDTLPDLPIKLLESLVPGYSTASRFLLQYFSIDISLYVSILAFLYASNRARKFLSSKLYDSFRAYCTSNVHIEGDDDLYELVIKWIAEMRPDLSSRWVLAKTQYGSAVVDGEKQEDSKAFLDAALDENGNFNFSRASARIPPRYEPYHGSYYFWHTWTDLFLVSRTERRKASDDGRYERLVEEIDIRCVGRSTAPTKRLLAEIKLWSVQNQISRTAISSPSSPDHGWYRRPWTKTSERPCRPMSTVILDPEQKGLIRQDMNEFLHPLSAKWYATRGIPYRRGYLFHGPPGTGKTSLSFALAGLFGLQIFIIPLMDPELSEAYLGRLFNTLPRRCIVLLEDIDTAGVQSRDEDDEDDDFDSDNGVGGSIKKKHSRKGDSAKEKKDDKKTTTDKNDAATNGQVDGETNVKSEGVNGHATPSTSEVGVAVKTAESEKDGKGEADSKEEEDKDKESPDPQKLTLTDLAKVMLSISGGGGGSQNFRQRGGRLYRRKNKDNSSSLTPERASNISLSGLLNVIDGVATHEGRILIMTTNHPEKLDSALIRAGRVDMQVQFTFATRQQMKHLFIRMYQIDIDLSSSSSSRHGSSSADTKKTSDPDDVAYVGDDKKTSSLSEADLEAIAQSFSEELPEETFAPSDVQGYLLMHKKSPRDALKSIGEWRDKKLAEMAEKAAKEKAKRDRIGSGGKF